MKNLFWLVTLAFLIGACSINDTQFTINGNIDGLPDGMVKLSNIIDGELNAVDSARSSGGVFQISGPIQFPELYLLSFQDQRERIQLFIEPGDVNVSGTVTVPVIKGSESQILYDKFNATLADNTNRRKEIYEDYKKAREADDEATLEAIEEQFNQIEEAEKEYILDFSKTNNASVVSPYIALRYNYYFDLDELEDVSSGLDASISESKYVHSLNKRIEKLRSVREGEDAPLFTQNDTLGNPVSLKNLRGKYLLIDFWASWCGPCRAENPNIVEAYEKYKDSGFDILGVSLDRNKERWIAAIAEDNLAWTHVSDLKYWDNEASKLYAVSSIPANFLLDPNGVIIAKDLRGEELQGKLEKIFSE
jgi:thiol-disulfide isomerase/thioredoxin